jgi:hypothetical protein
MLVQFHKIQSAILISGMSLGCLGIAAAHSLDGRISPDDIYRIKRFIALENSFGSGTSTVRGVLDMYNTWPDGYRLKICFLNGNDAMREIFAAVSSRWLPGTSLSFDFGPAPHYRTCDASQIFYDRGDIRVRFGTGGGGWSWVGRQNRDPHIFTDPQVRASNIDDASMSIGYNYDQLPPAGSQERVRLEGVILHEMGHALDLKHEHQSPSAHCDKEYNWDTIYKLYGEAFKKQGDCHTDEDCKKYTDAQFRELTGERYQATAYDQKSIMHYQIDSGLYEKGERSQCFIPHENNALSDTDHAIIRAMYPAITAAERPALQDRVDQATALLKELKLTGPQLSMIGVELANSLAAGGSKATVSLSFAPAERGRIAPRVVACDGPDKLPRGAICKVAVDGSGLLVSFAPE